MDDNLCITIPLNIANINDPESIQKAIATGIMENQQQFLPLLERLIDMGDARMSVIEGSLNVEHCDVDITSSEYMASGFFDSDFYAGCKDLNSQDDHEVMLPFIIEGGNLIFDIELPPAWRPGEYE